MDASDILHSLNRAQEAAVTTQSHHALVLAGAGTGKTRVLTQRICWLITTGQAQPHQIFAVTFTNKAAAEMRHRIETTLNGRNMKGMWIGTFHGISHWLLRQHWELAELPETFQILDQEEQLRWIKQLLKKLKLDDKIWLPAQLQTFINHQKEQGLRAQALEVSSDDRWLTRKLAIYAEYETDCKSRGMVDFAELLLRAYEILQQTQLQQHYQHRFRYLLVDEFQDTNVIQYELIRLLSGVSSNPPSSLTGPKDPRSPDNYTFAVGDDDQSIYSWRGAKVANLEQYLRDFPNSQSYRLEQNYRSTQPILTVANELIAHNQQRLGKTLWTQSVNGSPVFLYNANDDKDEANFIAEKISAWPGRLQDIAILYRTTAQSRLLEETLRQKKLSYRVYGGARFYERAEIRDILAYLRLIAHSEDDAAFERIINTPRRSIGERTLEKIRSLARHHQVSLWQATQKFLRQEDNQSKTQKSLHNFTQLIKQLEQECSTLHLDQQIQKVLDTTKLKEHYDKEGVEEGQKRWENCAELVNAARDFQPLLIEDLAPQFSSQDSAGKAALLNFLAYTNLESDTSRSDPNADSIQLMTLHSAKGLEFSMVFICGLEQNLFPHANSLQEEKLEEERRLFYVGITRARQILYLCHCGRRRNYGRYEPAYPSRFLQEIPSALLEPIKFTFKTHYLRPYLPKLGQPVKHPQFGKGTVLDHEGTGEYTRLLVQFAEGQKWLMFAYTDLELL